MNLVEMFADDEEQSAETAPSDGVIMTADEWFAYTTGAFLPTKYKKYFRDFARYYHEQKTKATPLANFQNEYNVGDTIKH